MRLCLLDLDGTLVEEHTLERLARTFGVEDAVAVALAERGQGVVSSEAEARRVVAVFEGLPWEEFAAVCAVGRPRAGASTLVAGLRRLDFRLGVVSASYLPAAESMRQLLDLDFAVGLEPVVEDGRLSGGLAPTVYRGACGRAPCKAAVLEALRAPDACTVAVGDGANDLCMVRSADLGIAVEPCHASLRVAADVVVRGLAAVPAVVRQHLRRPEAPYRLRAGAVSRDPLRAAASCALPLRRRSVVAPLA